MCKDCEPIRQIVEKPKQEERRSFKEFYAAIDALIHYIQEGVLELYAGDGPLETISQYFDTSRESAFVMHYFRCKTCNQFFLSGLYAYGEPLLKVSPPPSESQLRGLWGREGVYFETNS